MATTEYKFKVTPEIREAIYAAITHSETRHLIQGEKVARYLSDTRNPNPEITLTDTQVSSVLNGIEKAIEAQSSDMGDWVRASEYKKARDYLISETRKQFRVISTTLLILVINLTACTSTMKIEDSDYEEASDPMPIELFLAESEDPPMGPEASPPDLSSNFSLPALDLETTPVVANTQNNTLIVYKPNRKPPPMYRYIVQAGDTWYRLARWCLGLPYNQAINSRVVKIGKLSVMRKSAELQAMNPTAPILLKEGASILIPKEPLGI